MRDTLALIAGGAAAGVAMGILRQFGFGPTEAKVLCAIAGLLVWQSVKNGGKRESVPPPPTNAADPNRNE